MAKSGQLKRNITLPLLTLYGLGNILGAGIYVLVGKVAGLAGLGTALAFLIAMFVAGLTAFSYMELSGRYPVSASISVYLHEAFGRRWLSVLIGVAMIIGGVASAAALSQGFAGYLRFYIDVPAPIASAGILLAIGLIAIKGIKESAFVAAAFTLIEILGLILIIWVGKSSLTQIGVSDVLRVDPILGVGGVIAGAFLAFYAFIGFEDMVNVSEEVKNPRKTMPLAILLSLLISTVLYILVVVIAISVVSPQELSASSAPLALVYERTGSRGVIGLTAIGLIAAVNGIIVQIIMGSRVLYGLSKQGWIHRRFTQLHTKNQTPAFATVFIVTIMIVSTLLLPIVSLAKTTSLLLLCIFVLVNASLIAVKQKHKNHAGYITVPMFVPVLGAVSAASLIVYQLLRP